MPLKAKEAIRRQPSPSQLRKGVFPIMKKSRYTFAAAFTREIDGGYSVRFPQLDGCFTQGDSLEEAMDNAKEAMSLHLFGMEEDHEPIPETDLLPVVEPGEQIVLIQAWMTPFREQMRNQSVKKTLTIPAWLNAAAEEANINFSQVLQNALKDVLTGHSS